MLNGHFPFSFSHGTFYTHASHSSAASHWGFFVYLRMSLWPVEKVRVDKNLPYYLVQYAEPLHTPAAFLCQGWRSTGCPNPSPVYKAHCHENVNCKFFSICCQLPCFKICYIVKENEKKYISINLTFYAFFYDCF